MFNRPELDFLPGPQCQDQDAPIRQTDHDAVVARLSATQKNYLDDPFVKYFVPRAQFQQPRPPLINIGTYVRTKGIDDLVEEWLSRTEETGKQCQIVSLGAGSDTRFWRIATGRHKDMIRNYVEVDFMEVTTKKAMCIKKSRELLQVTETVSTTLGNGGAALHTPKYHLLAADLRSDPADTLQEILTKPFETSASPILSTEYPTLLLFECVLAYMTVETSSRLLQWFINHFSTGNDKATTPIGPLGCVIYEMFGLNDSFGKILTFLHQVRNVSIPGAEQLTSIDSLISRILEAGFHDGHALTLKEIRRSYIEPEELARISKLEFLDETEELDLVLAHYAISWGSFVSSSADRRAWSDWGLKESNQ
ncbi:carboxy methyl transferase for protein phosphatase 2A [Leucoagaricus gongylophorus]